MGRVIVFGNVGESLYLFRGKLLEEMVRNGHEVMACAPYFPEHINSKIIKIGVRPFEIDFNRVGLNPIRDIKDLSGLSGLFREFKPDIVLLYTVKPVVYGSICAKISGVPLIASIITGLGYSFIGEDIRARAIQFFVRNLYRIALKFNKSIFFQNPDDLNLFLSLKIIKNKRKSVIINGSGVDTEYFSPKPMPNEISFLLIARLIKDKGVREYVDASAIIKKRNPSVKFYLAGFIDKNPTAIKQIELDQWIQSGMIEFLGMLEDVRPAIANSSVYVLPSYREGTPRTVLEAMAMGRPIITTDTPGCRETVRDGINGYLVPIKNVTALVEAMEKFVFGPSTIPRMGMESRRIAEEKYEVTKVNQVIMENLGLISRNHV